MINTLTVIIADVERTIHLGEPVAHRSIKIILTPEQIEMLQLRHKYELISSCFLEEEKP